MPAKVSQAAPSGAAGVVDHADRRHDECGATYAVQPSADVRVLKIQKVARIKASNVPLRGSLEQQKHPGGPVDRPCSAVAERVVRAHPEAGEATRHASGDPKYRRVAADAILFLPVWADHARRGHSGPALTMRCGKCREDARRATDVGVKYREPRP